MGGNRNLCSALGIVVGACVALAPSARALASDGSEACGVAVRVVGTFGPDSGEVAVGVGGSSDTKSARTVPTVPNADGLVDLFNSNAGKFLLKGERDQKIFETYYKGFVGNQRLARPPATTPDLEVTRAAAKISAMSLADDLHQTGARHVLFEIDMIQEASCKDGELGELQVIGARALALESTRRGAGSNGTKRGKGQLARKGKDDEDGDLTAAISWTVFSRSNSGARGSLKPAPEAYFLWRDGAALAGDRYDNEYQGKDPVKQSVFDDAALETKSEGEGRLFFNGTPAAMLAGIDAKAESHLYGVFARAGRLEVPAPSRMLTYGFGLRLRKLSKMEFIERRKLEQTFAKALAANSALCRH